jgi:hypothetical protein
LANIEHFLATHADEAFALGWSGLDLFSVHPRAGMARVDSTGAVLSTHRVTAVFADRIELGRLTHRRHPVPGPRVLLWEMQGATLHYPPPSPQHQILHSSPC